MPFTVQLQWQPEAAIQSLSDEDRAAVQAAIGRLAEGRSNDVPQSYRIRGRANEPDFHVLRVNDLLRLVYAVDPAQQVIVVHDLINKNFVRQYG